MALARAEPSRTKSTCADSGPATAATGKAAEAEPETPAPADAAPDAKKPDTPATTTAKPAAKQRSPVKGRRSKKSSRASTTRSSQSLNWTRPVPPLKITPGRMRQSLHSGTAADRHRRRQKYALRDLIDQSLLAQRGKDMGFSVETDVVKQLDQIRIQNKLAGHGRVGKGRHLAGHELGRFQEQHSQPHSDPTGDS